MVDWKNIGTPIIVAMITLFGGFLLSYISSVFYKPDISIELMPRKGDIHNMTLVLQNKGSAPAKNLKLTIESPHRINNAQVFSTDNYTKRYTNSSSLEVDIPRFVHGKGSLLSIALSTDARFSITNNDHFTVYTTHDQGSDMNIEYILPRAPASPLELLSDWFEHAFLPTAGTVTTVAGFAAIITAFIQSERRRRLKRTGQSR